MPAPSDLSGTNLPGLLGVLVIFAIALAPVLFGRRGSAPGHSDEGSDEGGGGGGRPQPPAPTDRPTGGVPLDDAQPARVRLRTHARLADRPRVRDRRRSREPGRAPTVVDRADS